MIVDTSVLAAVLFDEPETDLFFETLASADTVKISAGSWIELTTVMARRGRRDLLSVADRMIVNFAITAATVTVSQARIGRTAYLQFGKGSGHRAKLNFGDCFAYALSKETGEPLLFKGDDFVHTDVLRAL